MMPVVIASIHVLDFLDNSFYFLSLAIKFTQAVAINDVSFSHQINSCFFILILE